MSGEMNFFLVALVLNIPPSLLQPLEEAAKLNVNETTKSVLITEASNKENKVNLTTPKSLAVNETIQQIDVKDEQNQLNSTVEQVHINDVSNKSAINTNSVVNVTNGTIRNDTNNKVLNNTLVTNTNVTEASNKENTVNVTIPNILAVNETIQQIDVKDERNQLNSTVEQVKNKINDVSNKSTLNNNSVVNVTNGTVRNDTNNKVLNNTLVTNTNVTEASNKGNKVNVTTPTSLSVNETIQQIHVKDEQNQLNSTVEQVNNKINDVSNKSTLNTNSVGNVTNGTIRNDTNNKVLNETLVTQTNVTEASNNENKVNVITPTSLTVNETIQQIHVKDEQNQLNSTVEQVHINDVSNKSTLNTNSVVNVTNGTIRNDTNNKVLNDTLITQTNVTEASSKVNEVNVTQNSFPVNETMQQIEVQDGQYQVNTSVKQVNSNGSTNSSSNINSTIKVLNNNDINNGTKLNDTNNILNNTLVTKTNQLGDQSNHTIDGDEITDGIALKEDHSNVSNATSNVISDKSNSTIENQNVNDTETSWRLDIPKKKYKNVSNAPGNSNLDIANYTTDPPVGKSKENLIANDENLRSILGNNQTENVFVIINSGNIEGFSVNSPVTGNNLTADEYTSVKKTNYNIDVNVESKNDNNLINSKQNSVAPDLPKQNLNNFNSKNIVWIYNSGNIINFRLNSPVSDITEKNNVSNDRSRTNSNNSTENSESSAQKTPIIDMKFRIDENLNKDNSNTSVSFLPLNINNDSYNSNSTGSNHLQNNKTNNQIENKILDDKSVKPLMSNENNNSDQVSHPTAVINDPNLNNNNSKILQPLSQLTELLDINNVDVVGNAIDLIKRLRRDVTDDKPFHFKNFAKKQLDDAESEEKNNEPRISNQHSLKKDLLINLLKSSYNVYNDDEKADGKLLKSARKFNRAENSDEKLDNFVDIECSLSITVKIILNYVLNILSESNNVVITTIYPILTSLIENHRNPINMSTLELLKDPFPLKIRVQLLHGDTKDFINNLSNLIDTTICQFTKCS